MQEYRRKSYDIEININIYFPGIAIHIIYKITKRKVTLFPLHNYTYVHIFAQTYKINIIS